MLVDHKCKNACYSPYPKGAYNIASERRHLTPVYNVCLETPDKMYLWLSHHCLLAITKMCSLGSDGGAASTQS